MAANWWRSRNQPFETQFFTLRHFCQQKRCFKRRIFTCVLKTRLHVHLKLRFWGFELHLNLRKNSFSNTIVTGLFEAKLHFQVRFDPGFHVRFEAAFCGFELHLYVRRKFHFFFKCFWRSIFTCILKLRIRVCFKATFSNK